MEAQDSFTEEKWHAILNNDASYDGLFIYAVKTTGIFCRPSCKSKPPRKENIRIFPNAEHAAAEGFRPCKRCRPAGRRLPDDEWVEFITNYIDGHLSEPLTLETLAEISHGSPYHLHRTFKRIKGVTPVEYIQRQRIEKAKERLAAADQPRDRVRTVAEIGSSVGLHNTPYFITLFKKLTGLTPAGYRQTAIRNPARGYIE